MKKTVYCTIFLFLVSFIYAAPKEPQWVTDRQGVYPYESYISESGSGNSAEMAKANALARLAGYINVTVTTDRTALEHSSMTSKDGDETYKREQDLVSVTNITSNADLFCVQYTEPFYRKKDKTYYAVAFINREEAWKFYSPKIESAKNKFNGFYQKAIKLSPYDPYTAISFLYSAKREGYDFSELCGFGRFISPECQKKYGSVQEEVDSVDLKIEQLFSESKIFVKVSGIVSGNSAQNVTQKIVNLFSTRGFVFVKDAGSANYVLNIELDTNESVFGQGTDDEIVTVYPSVYVYMENIAGGNTVFSLEENVTEKTAAYSRDAAVKKGFKKLSDKLDEKIKDVSIWKEQ